MFVMVGFSGAVEDGVRSIGMVVSLVAALVVGALFRSFAAGFAVFVVGNVIGFVWAGRAGEAFREQAFGTMKGAEDEDEPVH